MLPVFDWILRAGADGLTPTEKGKFAALMWRGLVAVHILWACGFLAYVGLGGGFAKADDVDQKVATAMNPVMQQLKEINQSLDKATEGQKRILIETKTIRIRELQKTCMTTQPNTVERNRLAAEIDMAQFEYKQLTGERYPLQPTCD